MAPPGRTSTPGQTAAMEQDVVAMEQRLAQLKATMSAEREKRSAAQKANPSGSVWRSGRTDLPVRGGKYVEQVLAAKGPAAKRAPVPSEGDGAAMGRTGNRFGLVPLVQPAGEGTDGAATAAGSGIAALRATAGTSTLGNNTRKLDEWAAGESFDDEPAPPPAPAPGSWNPMAAVADYGNDYEELLGPELGAGSGTSGGGGALWGTFDEDANRSSFAAAVAEWRGEPAPPLPTTTSLSAPAPRVAEGRGGGGALWGTFDEEANKAEFAAAVAAFRGQPAPAPASPPLTLAQKANELVGLRAEGALLEQVGRLLHELGLAPHATSVAAPASRPAAPTSTAVQASAGPSFFERLQEQKRKDGVL